MKRSAAEIREEMRETFLSEKAEDKYEEINILKSLISEYEREIDNLWEEYRSGEEDFKFASSLTKLWRKKIKIFKGEIKKRW